MNRSIVVICTVISVVTIHDVLASPARTSPVEHVVWVSQAVRWPVPPTQVDPTIGWQPPGVADTTAPVEITDQRAAVLWLGPAEIVRVRVPPADAPAVRLRRVSGDRRARLWLDEPAVPVNAGLLLIEPTGPGSTWVLTAARPLTITVERADRRAPRLAWEVLRSELVDWIDSKRELPPILDDEDGSFRIQLAGAHALVGALGPVAPRVAEALRVWRRAELEALIDLRRPDDDPYVTRESTVPAGATITDEEGAVYGIPPEPWRLSVEGPATIVVEARASRPTAGWASSAPTTIELYARASLIARRHEPSGPQLRRDDAALPQDPATLELGRRVRLIAAIGPGRHAVEVRVAGARWVRIEHRVRRPRLRDAIANDLGERIRSARAGLVGMDDRAAALADRLLARALGQRPSRSITGLPEPVALYELALGPGMLSPAETPTLISQAARLARADHVPLELRSAIVLELARRLPDGTNADELATAVLGWDPTRLAPCVLAVLAPHLRGGARSDAISAAEWAWRRAPTAGATRRAYLAVTRDAPMRRLDPIPTDAGEASRWLVPGSSVDPVDEDVVSGGSLVELELGPSMKFDVPPMAGDPTRLGVVRVFAVTPPDAPGPIRVWLDEREHTTVSMRPVERVELAAAPGRHELRVAAPPGSRVFIAGPGVTGARRGVIRTFRAAAAGESTPHYLMPAPGANGPVRIELRARIAANVHRRFEAWLRGDTGAPRRLVLEIHDVDREAWSLASEPALSPVAAAWIHVPALTGKLAVTSDHPELLVHLGVRRGSSVTEPAPPPAREIPSVDALSSITTLSAHLVTAPHDTSAYLARARALLGLGETIAARRDLAQAAATARNDQLDEIAATIAELEARVELAYLAAQPPGSRVVDGAVLVALPPPGDLAPVLALATQARAGVVPAPTPGVEPAWAQARIAELAGRHRDAAVAWRRVGTWQADVASLVALAAARFEGPEADAPAAYGLAAQLADIVLPPIRHARAAASRASRWSRIGNTEFNAGSVHLALPGLLDATPRGALRRALLAAPWPDGKLLDPGREVSFTLSGKRARVEGWCRPLWPVPGRSGSCELAVQIDQHVAVPMTVPYGQPATVEHEIGRRGRHVITVTGRGDPDMLAAVQVIDPAAPAKPQRRERWFLATSGRPAEIIVAGPMTLGIEVHPYTTYARAIAPRHAVVRVSRGRNVGTTRLALELDKLDPSAVRQSIEHVAVIPPGPHRIAIAPDRGVLAIRFARRVATPAAAVEQPPPLPVMNQLGGGLAWPSMSGIDKPLVIAKEPSPTAMMMSFETVVGRDELDELDADSALAGVRVEAAAQLRRRWSRTAWLAELRGRRASSLGSTARARLAGEIELPWGIDLIVDARAGVQPTSTATLWRLDGRLTVDRAFALRGHTELVPGLGVWSGVLGQEGPTGADPWILADYRRDHPVQVVLRGDLRGRPFADQQAIARLEVRSNADLASVDQVGATVGWRGLVELWPLTGPIMRLAYRPTYRLRDEDRPAAYLRHDVSAGLSWPVAVRRGRVVLSLRADLYPPSSETGWEHSLGFAVRWDDVVLGSRGRLAFEEPLSDFVDHRQWRDDP